LKGFPRSRLARLASLRSRRKRFLIDGLTEKYVGLFLRTRVERADGQREKGDQRAIIGSKQPLCPAVAASVFRNSSLKEADVAKKLYVGNLSYDVHDSKLQEMFEEFGAVQSAQVIMDRDTGRSKGFGFVEMSSDQEAQAAITGLNGKEAGGRALTVNEARPREDRGGRGGGGGRRGDGGGPGRDRGGYGGGRY
jgi:RNA recognition motif-containing protein